MKFASFFRPAHIPATLIMVALFYASSQPGSGMPLLHPPMDKVIHAFAYAVLGVAFCLWVREERWEKRPWLHGGIVWITCAIFGLTDEFHQSFVPGRMVSAGDLIADFLGSASAIIIYAKSGVYRLVDRYTFFRNTPGSD